MRSCHGAKNKGIPIHGSHLNWKIWEKNHFPVRKKSGNFTQNTGKSGNFDTEKWKETLEKDMEIWQSGK